MKELFAKHNMASVGTRGNGSYNPSHATIAFRYLVGFYPVLVIAALLYGWQQSGNFWLLVFVPFILVPFGFTLFGLYLYYSRQKTVRLAAALEQAALQLDDADCVDNYDVRFRRASAFVWRESVSALQFGVARFLRDFLPRIIYRARLGTGAANASATAELAQNVAALSRELARALRGEDTFRVYDILAQFCALALAPSTEGGPDAPLSMDTFTNACLRIAADLRMDAPYRARHALTSLLPRLRRQPAGSTDGGQWQAFIAYWLHIQLSFVESRPPSGRVIVGITPSQLLAMQVEMAVYEYRHGRFAALAEGLNDSFDWWTVVPFIGVGWSPKHVPQRKSWSWLRSWSWPQFQLFPKWPVPGMASHGSRSWPVKLASMSTREPATC